MLYECEQLSYENSLVIILEIILNDLARHISKWYYFKHDNLKCASIFAKLYNIMFYRYVRNCLFPPYVTMFDVSSDVERYKRHHIKMKSCDVMIVACDYHSDLFNEWRLISNVKQKMFTKHVRERDRDVIRTFSHCGKRDERIKGTKSNSTEKTRWNAACNWKFCCDIV